MYILRFEFVWWVNLGPTIVRLINWKSPLRAHKEWPQMIQTFLIFRVPSSSNNLGPRRILIRFLDGYGFDKSIVKMDNYVQLSIVNIF